ncbi:uncharacterized protein LOC124276676 [Haliotis rubra]|uniref:uncharacterized protein LOC124276676 n=1 Tax=Haliotis rubra TaxID=36100 RepID=UPI001EE5927B|nr:uncharacterized protein LOC124276676 [Haliotis rubra]
MASRLFIINHRVRKYVILLSVILVTLLVNNRLREYAERVKYVDIAQALETKLFYSNKIHDVHDHTRNEVDEFLDYSTSQNCTVRDLLLSADPSFNTVNQDLFCDEKAKSSDVICRWFFAQIGMSDIHDENACRRTGSDSKVPKIVYYVIFGPYTFQFYHYVSVVSARRFINPSAIYLIGDAHPSGVWWTQVLRDVPGVRFVYRERPPGINGKPVTWKHHLSDLVRLQALYANGGIYLDTDMVVTRPLEPLLDFDITMGLLDNGTGMGNAIILAKRGSKFVREWYEGYRTYNNKEFYKNSLHVPRDMWHKNPKSIHMESDRLYRPNWFESDLLFKKNDYPWRDNYAIHVWTNHNPLPKGFSDINRLNTTLGQIFRHVLYGSTDYRTDDR